MEVLRLPPYPITTTWDVPDANHTYVLYVEDVVDHSFETSTVESSSTSKIEYVLPRSKVQFDREFLFRVYDTDMFGEIVIDSNLTVYRPYVDPATLGTTASEIAEYKKLEIVARSIIDAYLSNDSATGEGFYNHKQVIVQSGQGTDYFPIWHNAKRILRVYENNTLIYNGEDVALSVTEAVSSSPGGLTSFTTSTPHNFSAGDRVAIAGFLPEVYNGNYAVNSVISSTEFDLKLDTYTAPTTQLGTAKRTWEASFAITLDNSSIYRGETGTFNRLESSGSRLPIGSGDLGYYRRKGSMFPRGYDYTFILDVGYKAVPADVEQAATMLIDDLKCGRNEYWKRFVTQYNTDQFDIKFAPAFLGGTGNLIVDRILDNYKGNVFKPGIL